MQYTHQPMRIQRTFVLEDQFTQKTKVIPFQVFTYMGQIDLFPLFSYALEELKNVEIRIYDFRINRYVDINTLGIRFHIPIYILDNGSHVVLIKYHTIHSETFSINSFGSSLFQDNKSETQSKKTERSKERIILEVIQIVRKWRKLCQSKKGVTLTLAQAANVVGLPKKSLDDYYYQLRMGQKYGFDYHAHIMERIGVLRSFLKKFKSHRKNDRNEKLPNILRIADEIEGYDNLIKENSSYIPEVNQQEIEEEEEEVEENYPNEEVKKQNIEKEFYNEFNYQMGKQNDPFLSLGKYNENHRIAVEDPNFNEDFEMFF